MQGALSLISETESKCSIKAFTKLSFLCESKHITCYAVNSIILDKVQF